MSGVVYIYASWSKVKRRFAPLESNDQCTFILAAVSYEGQIGFRSGRRATSREVNCDSYYATISVLA